MKMNQSAINAEFDNTEDQTQFNDQVLAGYDALVFLDNTGSSYYKSLRNIYAKATDNTITGEG